MDGIPTYWCGGTSNILIRLQKKSISLTFCNTFFLLYFRIVNLGNNVDEAGGELADGNIDMSDISADYRRNYDGDSDGCITWVGILRHVSDIV